MATPIDPELVALEQRLTVKLDSIAQNLETITDQLGRMTEHLTRLENLADRVLGAIDKQTDAINNHLKLAEQQAVNISELSKLVATQAATVDFLIRRGA
jgi:methyl-accepting chemotaxis protein